MVTTKDLADNVTAMARATANTISVVAQMIGNGEISKRGVYPPEPVRPGTDGVAPVEHGGPLVQGLRGCRERELQ